ncbi:MAG: hypothetical protein ABI589_00175 [Burkholderiales bacterium]
MSPLGCVTGRFQPVHEQHIELFGIALAECRRLIVAITNPDADARRAEPASHHRHTEAANPFSYFERVQLLELAIRDRGWDERIVLVPFDLTCPEHWQQYVPHAARQFVRAYGAWERQKAASLEQEGYSVRLIEGNRPRRISSSDIRASMKSGDGRWQALVPPATVVRLTEWLERTQAAKSDRQTATSAG